MFLNANLPVRSNIFKGREPVRDVNQLVSLSSRGGDQRAEEGSG